MTGVKKPNRLSAIIRHPIQLAFLYILCFYVIFKNRFLSGQNCCYTGNTCLWPVRSTDIRIKSFLCCVKNLGMLAENYACETIASAAVNSGVPSVLPGQLTDLRRPLDGPQQLHYIGKKILVEKRLWQMSFLHT